MKNLDVSNALKSVTLGSDPEFFLWDDGMAYNGLVSAIKEFPGMSKNKPIELSKEAVMYPDNALVELRFNPGVGSMAALQNLSAALRDATKKLRAGLKILARSAEFFPSKQLISKKARRMTTLTAEEVQRYKRHLVLRDVGALQDLLQRTARRLPPAGGTRALGRMAPPLCGGDRPDSVPNNYCGHGRVDVLAAVSECRA